MARVQAPDGTLIDFPESMKDSDIEAAMGKLYPKPGGIVQAAKDAGSGFLQGINPFHGLAAAWDAIQKDPEGKLAATKKLVEDSAINILAHPYKAAGRAIDALKSGKPEEAAAHLQSALDPTGFQTEEAQTKIATPGQRTEGAFQLLGQLGQALVTAGAANPKVRAAVSETASGAAQGTKEVLQEVAARNPHLMKAAGAAVGGTVGHAIPVPGSGFAGVYAGREAGAALSEAAANALKNRGPAPLTEPPPLPSTPSPEPPPIPTEPPAVPAGAPSAGPNVEALKNEMAVAIGAKDFASLKQAGQEAVMSAVNREIARMGGAPAEEAAAASSERPANVQPTPPGFKNTQGPYGIINGSGTPIGSYDTLADAQKAIQDSRLRFARIKITEASALPAEGNWNNLILFDPKETSALPQSPVQPIEPPAKPSATVQPPGAAAQEVDALLKESANKTAAQEVAEALTGKPEGGTIPFSKESPPAETFKTAARTERGPKVELLARRMHETGITPDALDRMQPSQWRDVADALKIDLPKTLTATIRDVKARLAELGMKPAEQPVWDPARGHVYPSTGTAMPPQ